MRFYDPTSTPPDRLDSLKLFPKVDEKTGAKRCLKMGLYPSVTTVLNVQREEYLERWLIKEAIKEVQGGKTAAQAVAEVYDRESPNAVFGTGVHAIAEEWFDTKLGKDFERQEFPELVQKHAAPLIKWFEANVKEVVFSEVLLQSPSMKVAGAVDLGFVDMQDRLIVGDIKVVKFSDKFPPSPGLAYRCQLSAYREMLREWDGRDYHRISLYLASPFGWDTKPRLRIFEHEKCHLEEFRACRLLWEGQTTAPDLLTIDPFGTPKKLTLPKVVSGGWTPGKR